jgi:predicted amidohydrolase
MNLWFSCAFLLMSACHASALVTNQWSSWTPRAEIAPRFSIEPGKGRSGSAALHIATSHKAQFGAWTATFTNLIPAASYKFSAWYKAENVPHERRSVIARLLWIDAKANPARPPEYPIDVETQNGWTHLEYHTVAPEKADTLQVQLSFGFTADASILWNDIALTEQKDPPNRVVRAVAIHHRPRNTKSSRESLEQFLALASEAAKHNPDIICLPEGVTVVGTGKAYAEVAEPIPGPSTQRIGEVARQLRSYIVAGLYEQSGNLVYNTAVLVARDGSLAGVYRKTHLPREEWESGITPGNDYPVFQTDFAKVGLIVCWDVQFPEPARAMALKGAEILLLPIWGGSDLLARARAIENHVFLVSSSYDMRTFIVDPAGSVLSEATADSPFAAADLRLDSKIYQPWLGDMKNRTWKERRPDIPVEPGNR